MSLIYTSVSPSQSELVMLIERLVQAIEHTNDDAFKLSKLRLGCEQFHTTKLSKYFDNIQKMVSLFDEQQFYDFSEHLQVFWQACQDIGLTCFGNNQATSLSGYEALNELVNRIRRLVSSKKFLRRKADRCFQAKDQQRKIADYVDNVMDRYSRTVVVRIDLYYLSETQARQRVEDVFADQDRLSRGIERNPIFEDLTGHICSIEQGKEKSYHIHAAFFFNGAKVRNDFYKARQIGELWKQITDGKGYYHSCNDDKARYGDSLGIGVIKRDDVLARRNMHKAMSYLAKETQYLRMKPRGARCMRKGLLRRISVPEQRL